MGDPPHSSLESPLDRALSLAIAGDDEGALAWSAALVAKRPSSAAALLVAARALASLGRKEAAVRALELSVSRSIDQAHLALAVAACRDLAALGADAAVRLDAITAAFEKDSRRLSDGVIPPPEIGGSSGDFEPVSATGASLLDRAEEIVGAARVAFEQEADSRDAPPKLTPQPLFSSLSKAALRAMMGSFEVKTVPLGEVLVEEGTPGREAFVVARGELEVQRASSEEGGEALRLARLGADALFGEMALLSRAPRAASVIAARPSIVLVTTRESLDDLAEKMPEVGIAFAKHCHRRMVDNLVRTSAILGAVKPTERPAVIERFVTRTFEPGDQIIVQGEQSEGLHLIASGEVSIVHREGDDSTLITRLGPGEVVGEVALVLRRPSNADVVAEHPTVTLHLPHQKFMEVIKQHPTLLSELYELAVKRDEQTTSIVAQEATEVDDLILI